MMDMLISDARAAVMRGEYKTEYEYEVAACARAKKEIEAYLAAKERGEILDPTYDPIREWENKQHREIMSATMS